MPIVNARINEIDRMLSAEQYPQAFDVEFDTHAKKVDDLLAFMPISRFSSIDVQSVDAVARFVSKSAARGQYYFAAQYIVSELMKGTYVGMKKRDSPAINTVKYSHSYNPGCSDESVLAFGHTYNDGSFREVNTRLNGSDLRYLVVDVFGGFIPAKLDKLKQAGKIGSVPDDRVLLK